jgi:26S proteasome regulatory subunit N3
MLSALRTATLRYDTDTQGTLLTLLLRNFIHYKLYDQADKLVSRTQFPESSGNNLFARYLYYLGRIRAIQLDYSAAHQQLLMAIRKAPQQNKAAAGFLQTVHKFFVVVELLMGDIPERGLFRQPMLEKVLAPYSQIVQGTPHLPYPSLPPCPHFPYNFHNTHHFLSSLTAFNIQPSESAT